ncbi:MAG: OmpA family protein, partial [Janthinobacterium lividum]
PGISSEVAQDLVTARTPPNGKHADGKLSLIFARQATQRAEDARISALHKEAAARLQVALQATTDAQAQVDAARAAQAQAEAQRDQALSATAQAQAAADLARQNAAANQETAAALRAKLRAQLNAVLETRESARGLIVNVSGVLFDTGKSTLKTNAKLRLTRVATILSLYPSLKLQVEGYTDSTGSQELNQKLSEERAQAVADFLTANGVSSTNLTSTGLGESNPVATNATAAGRTKNRRVNLVVSGSLIGVNSTTKP